jgi:hypothetical protein
MGFLPQKRSPHRPIRPQPACACPLRFLATWSGSAAIWCKNAAWPPAYLNRWSKPVCSTLTLTPMPCSCYATRPPGVRWGLNCGAPPGPRGGAWPRAPAKTTVILFGPPAYCGYDADPTGHAMAQTMIARYPAIQRLRPALKDWNDVLRSLV